MMASPVFLLFYLIFCTSVCFGWKPIQNKEPSSPLTTHPLFKPPDSFAIGQIIKMVPCLSNPKSSYALYLPPQSASGALPIVYFFDPHASGAFPLTKYKSLADHYGFILVGSNDSKNGNDWTTTKGIINTLIGDTRKRLRIQTGRMYTCGFSGGAKAAGYAALDHSEIQGLIVGGAGLPDGIPVEDFPFSFIILLGQGDMNRTELVALNMDLDKTRTFHCLISFHGKHEWAPEETMDMAFAGLTLDAMRKKTAPIDQRFIDELARRLKKKATDDIAKNDLLAAHDACELAVNLLKGLALETEWFAQKEAQLDNYTEFQRQLKADAVLLEREQRLKTYYDEQFQKGDESFWSKTIRDLQSKSKSQNAEAAMYQRLLAYLSLAFYSISNRFITVNQNLEAGHFVGLYKLADPSNSEAWYFSALLNARSGNAKATQLDLLKAVENGFTDKARLLAQPEFRKISDRLDLALIEKKMGGKPN